MFLYSIEFTIKIENDKSLPFLDETCHQSSSVVAKSSYYVLRKIPEATEIINYPININREAGYSFLSVWDTHFFSNNISMVNNQLCNFTLKFPVHKQLIRLQCQTIC